MSSSRQPAAEPRPHPRTPVPTTVSVVVPTRHRIARLTLTLTALLRQEFPAERFEVIVVDDAPSDSPVPNVLAALDDERRIHVVSAHGSGVANARNVGAEHAHGDLLLFVDDDTVCGPHSLQQHIQAHNAETTLVAHGTVTDLAAFRFDPDSPTQPSVVHGVSGRSLSVQDVPISPQQAARLGPRRSVIEKAASAVLGHPEWDALHWLGCIGTNTSLKQDVFQRAGGFDIRYGTLWGGEDLELGIRLLRGHIAEFVHIDTTAYHLGSARHDADESLTRFWQLAAEYHGDQGLLAVAEFLRGKIGLVELNRAHTHQPNQAPST